MLCFPVVNSVTSLAPLGAGLARCHHERSEARSETSDVLFFICFVRSTVYSAPQFFDSADIADVASFRSLLSLSSFFAAWMKTVRLLASSLTVHELFSLSCETASRASSSEPLALSVVFFVVDGASAVVDVAFGSLSGSAASRPSRMTLM